jgi:hypothetical protein
VVKVLVVDDGEGRLVKFSVDRPPTQFRISSPNGVDIHLESTGPPSIRVLQFFHVLEQNAQRGTQGPCDLSDHGDADADLASFDHTHVSSMDSGLSGETFLGHAQFLPPGANSSAQEILDPFHGDLACRHEVR